MAPEPVYYTVTFDVQGHGTAPKDQQVLEGGHATLPTPTPSETGWAFKGWYADKACTEAFRFTSTEIKNDTTVYARWVKLWTVRFDVQGHGTAPANQTVEDGSTASRPGNPTANTYSFGGWYTDSGCTTAYDFSSPVTGNLTLYAKWTYTGKGPKTGDESSTGLWIALACVGAAGLVGTGLALKKRKRK